MSVGPGGRRHEARRITALAEEVARSWHRIRRWLAGGVLFGSWLTIALDDGSWLSRLAVSAPALAAAVLAGMASWPAARRTVHGQNPSPVAMPTSAPDRWRADGAAPTPRTVAPPVQPIMRMPAPSAPAPATPLAAAVTLPVPTAVPRFGRGSKAQARPWHLPEQPVQAGVSADEAQVRDVAVRAGSVVGPGHRCENPAHPRQDAYRVARTLHADGVVAVVTDGVSSSRHAETGAAEAAAAAVRLLHDQTAGGVIAPPILGGLYRSVAAHLAAIADQQHWELQDLCCAMITALVPATGPGDDGRRTATVSWVGDVSAWLLRDGSWFYVAGDRKGGDDGGVESVAVRNPMPFGAAHVETIELPLQRGDVLTLVTDGVGDGLASLPDLRDYLAQRWQRPLPITDYLCDIGYDAERFLDDRTAVSFWIGSEPLGRRGAHE